MSSKNSILASKDGHDYHEAWAARRALELLLPKDGLCAIAIEGLSPKENGDALPDEADEIADVALYFGKDASFEACDRLEILQMKYSVTRSDKPFVASDAKETLEKFAAADAGFVKAHGAQQTQAKASYALIINRPAGPAFVAAIEAAAAGRDAAEVGVEVGNQFAQIAAATGLQGDGLRDFCNRLSVQAIGETPASIRHGASRTLADWGAADGAPAELRLHRLCRLVRDKAGMAGKNNNLIRLVNVLGALEVHEGDLLPAMPSFVDVGSVVARAQLGEVVAAVRASDKPVLLQATGGVGKTVFMQSLAQAFAPGDHAVLFDCFGGGAYRSPEDERHLARRGLLHIVNELATRGLCDVILPDSPDGAKILQTARARFAQAVRTLRSANPGARLIVLIDAADNAAKQAQDRHEPCFATAVLEAFDFKPEPGVSIVASCRPNRAARTKGLANPKLIDLEVFSEAEARAFILARAPKATEANIATAFARSLRNPRVLAHLIDDWDTLVVASTDNAPIKVETLIAARVDRALGQAGLAGGDQERAQQFLAGLTLLPTPIPVEPFAAALGIGEDEIASFCADLAPLLEQGGQGVSFRDEPTETYISEHFAADKAAIAAIAARLDQAQVQSLYAARALPRVLQIAGDADAAIALALSDVMPSSLQGDVAKRELRAARVSAAIAMAAKIKNADHLVALLVEMSGLAAVNSRGDDFLSANPDLVYLSSDPESLRRVLEHRGGWQGRRHARACIVNSLYGDRDEALHHAIRTYQWIDWYWDLDDDDRYRRREHPSAEDCAAAPFFLAVDDKPDEALTELKRWRPAFGFQVAERVLSYLDAHPQGSRLRSQLISAKTSSLAFAAAALASGASLDVSERKVLVDKLVAVVAKLEPPDNPRAEDSRGDLDDALVIAAAHALALGRTADAQAILAPVAVRRVSIYDFERERLFPAHAHLLIAPIVRALAFGRGVTLRDLLPREIAIYIGDADPADLAALIATIDAVSAAGEAKTGDAIRDNYVRDEALKFKRGAGASALMRLHGIAEGLRAPLADASLSDDAAIAQLIALWTLKRVNTERYRDSPKLDALADAIHGTLVFFAMNVRCGYSATTARAAIAVGASDEGARWFSASEVAVLSATAAGQEAAGLLAKRVAETVDTDDFPTHRGDGFARLAHAILPASREEAVEYFRRGLRELDTIGAGDYALMQELLWLTSKLKGAHLDPALGQRLMNLCAINFAEEPSKFPWAPFAAAAAHGIGAHALGQISRWDQRDDAGFNNTLAPCIARFTETGLFSTAQTLSLLMLEEPAESWGWRMGSLVEQVLKQTPIAERPAAFAEIMRQMRLCEPDGVSPLSLEAIEPIAASFPELTPDFAALAAETKDSRTRNDADNDRRNSRSTDAREDAQRAARERLEKEDNAALARIVAATDPASAASIEQHLDIARGLTLFPLQDLFLGLLRDATPYQQRLKHIEALATAKTLHLHTRLDALDAAIKLWSPASVAIEALRPDLAELVLGAAGDELVEGQYSFGAYISQLARISGKPNGEVAMRVVEFAADHGVVFEASGWLELAILVADAADPQALRAALTRLLESDAAKLADARFDGVYKSDFDVPAEASALTARLIWQRLGAPGADERWRAAHAVRLLARYGLRDELTALCELLTSGALGGFGDAKIKVHLHNGRLWLLIALARASLDHPENVSVVQGFLEGVVAKAEHYHVGMLGFAARALDSIYAWRGGMEQERAALARVTEAPLARAPREKGFYGRANRDREHFGDDRFYFEYDFEKYDIPGVGDLFQLSFSEIEQKLVQAIAEIDPSLNAMHETGGRRGGAESWRRRRGAGYSTYGEQVADHALTAVASQLALTHAVHEGEIEDPWTAWLKDKNLTRGDGLWLSDGLDRYPVIALEPLLRRTGQNRTLSRDPKDVCAAVGYGGYRAPDWLMIDGQWSSRDSVSVSVSSALLPRAGAFHFARKFAGGAPYHLWTPSLKGEEELVEHGDFAPLVPWIVDIEHEPYLDNYDPFGARSANERSRLGASFAERLGLKASDVFGREWLAANGEAVLRARAWGKRSGYGEHERYESGASLEMRADALMAYLRDADMTLLVIVKLNYHPPDRGEALDSKPDKANAVMLISGAGSVKYLKTKRVREPKRRRSRPGSAQRKRRRAEKQEQTAWFETILAKMTTEQLAELEALVNKKEVSADG